MNMTPLHLKILLHVYANCEPYPNVTNTVAEYGLQLIEWGLIQEDPNSDPNIPSSGYITTGKGNAHIEQLLQLPLPSQGWIDAQGNVIKRKS